MRWSLISTRKYEPDGLRSPRELRNKIVQPLHTDDWNMCYDFTSRILYGKLIQTTHTIHFRGGQRINNKLMYSHYRLD